MNNLPEPKAWILDVGHGNATVIEDTDAVFVIDGGGDDTLVQFLSDKGIAHIDNVIVSHADADHFGGISLLLSDDTFEVANVYLNEDPRNTRLWNDFVSVMMDAKQRGTHFNLELNNANPGELGQGSIRLEVQAPSQELMYKTVAGRDSAGNQLTANSMSAVVRVWSDDSPRILLPADIDHQGLEYLLDDATDLQADVLVYPHHGGSARTADEGKFAQRLIEAVPSAQLVVFSISRSGPYRNPIPEHVRTVRQLLPKSHIACTQLSVHCSDELPSANSPLHHGIGKGIATYSCCAGTIEVSLSGIAHKPDPLTHQEFIAHYAPKALCKSLTEN